MVLLPLPLLNVPSMQSFSALSKLALSEVSLCQLFVDQHLVSIVDVEQEVALVLYIFSFTAQVIKVIRVSVILVVHVLVNVESQVHIGMQR